MKKCINQIIKNKGLSLGIFLAGCAVTYGAMVVINPQVSNEETQETYSVLGYGRGNKVAGQDDTWNTTKNNKNSRNNKDGSRGGYNQELTKENCLADGCLLVEDANYPVAQLDEKTIGYLEAALADEQKALLTYQAVMDKFGNVKPFINIARAEEQHISTLKALFDKYGVEIPKQIMIDTTLPTTLAEVCAVGVQAEIDNDALYQSMISDIKHEDIKTIFTSLAAASIDKHLPAFERCAN